MTDALPTTYADVSGEPNIQATAVQAPALRQALIDLGFEPRGYIFLSGDVLALFSRIFPIQAVHHHHNP